MSTYQPYTEAPFHRLEVEVARYRLAQYTSLATFVVIFFEYWITFDRELSYAWSRKLSWARVLFLFNRYISLVEYFATLGVVVPPSYFSCVVLGRVQQVCIICLYAVWAAFSGLRVYAIGGKNRSVATIVVLLSLVPVAMNIALSAVTKLDVGTFYPLPLPDICSDTYAVGSRMTLSNLGLFTHIPLLLSEVIVIVVTITQTWALAHSSKHHFRMSFASLVLREGVVYFFAMLLTSTALIVSDYILEAEFAVACYIISLMKPILVSRFYLNVGEHCLPHPDTNSNSRWKPLPPIPNPQPTPPDENPMQENPVQYVREVLKYKEGTLGGEWE